MNSRAGIAAFLWPLAIVAAFPATGCGSARTPGAGGNATAGEDDGSIGAGSGGTTAPGETTPGGSSSSGGAAGSGGGTGSSGAIGTGGSSSSGGSLSSGGTGSSSGIAGGLDGGRGDAARDATTSASDSGGAVVDPTKKITVWLAGDSTMQPCTTACPCGWGSQFQPYLNGNATVVNSGAGGRSIQTWLYDPNVTTALGSDGECVINPKTFSARWQAMLDGTNGMKPGDYLFIEFGINDTDAVCNRHVGAALFQTYLGIMAQAAKDRGAQPIFLTSTSYMLCTGNTVLPNRAFGPETKAASAADNVPLIDLTSLSAALYTSLGLCPNDGNFASTTTPLGLFFCNDHTHFEAAGAAQIAGVVAKALRDQNIGLAAYLK